MGQPHFGSGRTGWILAGMAVMALAPAAPAYINGGDFHSTLKDFEKSLKSDGWGAAFAPPVPRDCVQTKEVAADVKVVPRDNPDYERYVNQLVARSLRSLPEKEADRISADMKRDVARLTREALHSAIANRQTVIKKGKSGALHYQVGAYAFESYWETNYGGKREIHARQTGLVPFVALKVAPARD
jgi:hypothetical protein